MWEYEIYSFFSCWRLYILPNYKNYGWNDTWPSPAFLLLVVGLSGCRHSVLWGQTPSWRPSSQQPEAGAGPLASGLGSSCVAELDGSGGGERRKGWQTHLAHPLPSLTHLCCPAGAERIGYLQTQGGGPQQLLAQAGPHGSLVWAALTWQPVFPKSSSGSCSQNTRTICAIFFFLA